MATHQPNRRDLLKLSLAAGAGLALPSLATADAPATAPTTAPANRAKPFRVVHLTDTHVQPELGAGDGLVACLRHIHEHNPPDLIIAGGDNVFDAYDQDHDRAQLLFDLWTRIIADECKAPLITALGNHDIWGWNKKKSKTAGDEPGWGKEWAVKVYGLPNRYYSVDRGGWHIALLDSVQPEGESGYCGKIDDEQFAWLRDDLARIDPATPVLIVSHIPIVALTPLFFGKTDTEPRKGDALPVWTIPRGEIFIDARQLKDLFKQHANVKLAISGHIHMADRFDYLGITYLNNTAVSGNWWKGDVQEFKNGYTVLDLNADGTFAHQTVSYGWESRT